MNYLNLPQPPVDIPPSQPAESAAPAMKFSIEQLQANRGGAVPVLPSQPVETVPSAMRFSIEQLQANRGEAVPSIPQLQGSNGEAQNFPPNISPMDIPGTNLPAMSTTSPLTLDQLQANRGAPWMVMMQDQPMVMGPLPAYDPSLMFTLDQLQANRGDPISG